MKTLLTVLALALPLVLCYDEKFDKMDVDKIIADDALFASYINCLLDKGPCDDEHSAEIKKLLPELIATTCAKCTPTQKEGIRKTVKVLSEKHPEQLIEFRNIYDPKGEHEKSFMAFVLGE